MKAPSPYAQTEYNGRPMLNVDKAFVMAMEHELGYGLTITQAIGGAAASAGYHLKGRMLDLPEWDGQRKLRVAVDLGGIGWIRDERDGMVPHEHLGIIFESRSNQRGISAGGFLQIGAWDRGEDGLVGNGRDRSTYRPSPKRVFTRERYEFIIKGGLTLPQPNAVTRMRDRMVEAMQALTDAIHEGKETDGRPAIDAAVKAMKQERREIRERLEKMPKR